METDVKILIRLNGEQGRLRLFGIYEGRRYLYLVTELYLGGDLENYRQGCLTHYDYKKNKSLDDEDHDESSEFALLPTNLVREVAIRILEAFSHCATHDVMHRGIKRENITMMNKYHPESHKAPDDLMYGLHARLIDYGSGCIDAPPPRDPDKISYEPRRHNTMAGSAFYNSPEMFRKSYTYKTDVWSAGVTIYVFAAGFPVESRLQSVFDTMIKAPKKGGRNLKKNLMPPDADDAALPDAFWSMLDKALLVYKDSARLSAGDALHSCAFLQ